MNFRAVFAFLGLLIAHAACHPIKREVKDAAVKDTFKMLQEEIGSALGHLAEPGLLPNVSCASLNVTELLGRNQQPLHHQIPSFRCYMQKFSKRIPELRDMLEASSQYLLDVEKLQNGRMVPRNCSLPNFEQDLDRYWFAKCLLQYMEERFSILDL